MRVLDNKLLTRCIGVWSMAHPHIKKKWPRSGAEVENEFSDLTI